MKAAENGCTVLDGATDRSVFVEKRGQV